MSYFYDKRGVPLALLQWGKLFDDWEYKCVGQDLLAFPREHVRISTVWLGLDHGFNPNDPPLIFETMIFGGKHDEFFWRYSTLEQAEFGHSLAVEAVRLDKSPNRVLQAKLP